MKTKKIDGFELPASSFAYVGDPDVTSTWKLPIFFPGNGAKTVEHINNALARFDDTKAIAPAHRRMVWQQIIGAAKAHGLPFYRNVKIEVTDEELALLLSERAAKRFMEEVIYE